MADKRKAILIRLPVELWEQLNRWAADELRSVNSQIEYVLRNAARKRTGEPAKATPLDEEPPRTTSPDLYDAEPGAAPPTNKKGPLSGA